MEEATPAQEAATPRSPEPEYSSVTLRLSSSDGGIEIETFILAALAVLAAYGHLLIISISYIKLAPIPAIMLAFIGAVACKFYYYSNNSSGGWQQQYYHHDDDDKSSSEQKQTRFASRGEKLVAFVPQLVQLLCSGLDNSKFAGLGGGAGGQQQNDDDSSFLVSHFLFFFSSSIGALQVMMATLPLMRVAKVSQVLRMTFRVALNLALHAKVAEWVGENLVLVCMPELVAALLWFIPHFDHTKCIDSVISSFESGGSIPAAAAVILVSMFEYERDVVSMLRVLASACALSGMLSYLSMWMISGTGTDDDSAAKVPIRLLKFSAHICFGISASWVSALATLHFNLAETVTSFVDVVEAAPQMMFLLDVLGFLTFGLLFLFLALDKQQTGVGAPSPSSTSSRRLPLLSSIYVNKWSRPGSRYVVKKWTSRSLQLQWVRGPHRDHCTLLSW